MVASMAVFSTTPATTLQINNETKDEIKIDETLLRAGYCETKLNHYAPDGSVIKGFTTPSDTGMFQISLKYHGKRMEQLGLSAALLSDNAKYAQMLFEEEGAKPWKWSYNPQKDECKNGLKLPSRESKEWKSVMNRALSVIGAKLK